MSIWSDIAKLISETAADVFSAIIEAVRTVFSGDADTRRRVAFSIAIIALSAKMAKADGVVTEDEIGAFQRIFIVPEKEFNHVAQVYNLAKQDVAGYDSYARQIAGLFADDPIILVDVLEALFHIASADGVVHENEMLMLEDIAHIFAVSQQKFEQIRLRYVIGKEADPYEVLGASRDWDFETLRKHHRQMVIDNHPDRLIARGVPEEFLAIAHDRMADINAAWDVLQHTNGQQKLPADSWSLM